MRRMPVARTIEVRRGETIDELREIVCAALRVTDSGKIASKMGRVRWWRV